LVLPSQTGEERINSLNFLATSLSFVDYDQSMRYADEAISLATKMNWEDGIAGALRNYGHIYLYKGNYPKALHNYLEAFALYEKLKSKHTAGWVCYDICRTHYFANNYEKAIEVCNMALDIMRERTNDGSTVGNVCDTVWFSGGLSEIYATMSRWDKTLEIRRQNYQIMKRNNFSSFDYMLMTYGLGIAYEVAGEYDSANIFYRLSLDFPNVSHNITTMKYRILTSVSSLHWAAGEIDSAIYYTQIANDFYNKRGFLFMAMRTSIDLGYLYYRNTISDSALKYLQLSERVFDEMLSKNSWHRYDSLKYIASWGLETYFPYPPVRLKELIWQQGVELYWFLNEFYKEKKLTDEAYKYHIAYANAKDTLNKLQRNRETLELQTNFESERKDRQIEKLSLENLLKESRLMQNRYFLFGSIGLFVLILILVIILFRQNKLRTDQQMMVLQQRLFRSQMNPHFIFNSLTSIQNFIVKQDARQANIFLSRFSELVRNILDTSTKEYVSLDKEINTIKNYLELQKVRYADKFDFEIFVDEMIDTENLRIPPMLAQPMIENAIEHGIKNMETPGLIQIRFQLLNGMIRFEVEDNGIGREKAMEFLLKREKEHKSLATSITRERIQILNKRLNKKISLKIIDLKEQDNQASGTNVILEIPVIWN